MRIATAILKPSKMQKVTATSPQTRTATARGVYTRKAWTKHPQTHRAIQNIPTTATQKEPTLSTQKSMKTEMKDSNARHAIPKPSIRPALDATLRDTRTPEITTAPNAATALVQTQIRKNTAYMAAVRRNLSKPEYTNANCANSKLPLKAIRQIIDGATPERDPSHATNATTELQRKGVRKNMNAHTPKQDTQLIKTMLQYFLKPRIIRELFYYNSPSEERNM